MPPSQPATKGGHGPLSYSNALKVKIPPPINNSIPDASRSEMEEQFFWLNQRKHVDRERLTPGTIIYAPVTTEDYKEGRDSALPGIRPGAPVAERSNISRADSRISRTNYCYVITKLRYMIVVATYTHHYICVPLHTHQGKGLEGKSEQYKKDCVSVRDGRISEKDFKVQNTHKALVTSKMSHNEALISEFSTAMFTRPITRSYDLRVYGAGSLEPNSIKWLLKLFGEAMAAAKNKYT